VLRISDFQVAGGGGIKLNISITITIPDRLAGLFVALALFYRWLRYGYILHIWKYNTQKRLNVKVKRQNGRIQN
jgi:hypothetical protein